MKQVLFFLFIVVCIYMMQAGITGCGQILAPTGGPKDTIPPRLLNALPDERSTNVSSKKIVLNFDEYVQLDKLQENLIVSPTPKILPVVDYKFKTVTIKLKDTLLANTTYSINIGNAIKDLNEGNPFRKYTYVFSTGPYIDSLEYDGKVYMAETGKADSTLQVYLYRNAPDSAVEKRRPDYISRLDSSGNFSFSYLPSGSYKVYALKDGDGSKTYNSKIEPFAFLNKDIIMGADVAPDTLFAYSEEKDKPRGAAIVTKTKILKDAKLKISGAVPPETQDILKPFTIEFSAPLKTFEASEIVLSDTLYHTFSKDSIKLDSTHKILNIYEKWEEDTHYRLVIPKNSVIDSNGNMLPKSDTIKFISKKRSDYGSLKLHFKNLLLDKNPVLQFVSNNEVKKSFPVVSNDWSMDLLTPAEYEVRILYDTNNNGIWDPGNYHLKRQPEKVISINKKITIRPNFDSDVDIDL